MFVLYVVVAGATVLANTGIAGADLVRADFVLANSAEVGVPRSWLPWLAGLKAAGAAGVLLGLLGVPVIGIAAAGGLVAFFLGAVIAHLRARVYHNVAFPGCYLALAVASLAFAALR
ncbi:DoxX family protein [Pseudofrankia inefficax]|uniref:Integral membrane protein n=1 Tax=Pseudofrankia inefficax (strain DSM 45817 / CECT 9037 / DDB 130130 / EuI1c) TaxID=298654 RepID=E3IVP5_PSEI1|nr:DoxX family protein [Pseudofrankia inefficax]ADP83697.1 integral membrane protein [Pseudofrankia inefficax]